MAPDKTIMSAFAQLSAKIAKLEKAKTRISKGAPRSARVSMTVTTVTPTPLEGAGLVAHGGATVVGLC